MIPASALKFFSDFHIVEQEVLDEVVNALITKTLKKKEFLIREGQVCKYLFFIEKGLLRKYYQQDKQQVTTWFGFENECIICLQSFLSQVPSQETIIAEEDTTVYGLPFDLCFSLMKRYHSSALIGGLLAINYLLKVDEWRLLMLQHKTAKERYHMLSKENPKILQRCSLTDIASYMGISLETLSRLRAKNAGG